MYKVGFASKQGTPLFGPLITSPVFKEGQEFRDFLLAKILNGERGNSYSTFHHTKCSFFTNTQAAMHSPSFAPKITRTRRILLEELHSNHTEKKRGKLSQNFHTFVNNK